MLGLGSDWRTLGTTERTLGMSAVGVLDLIYGGTSSGDCTTMEGDDVEGLKVFLCYNLVRLISFVP